MKRSILLGLVVVLVVLGLYFTSVTAQPAGRDNLAFSELCDAFEGYVKDHAAESEKKGAST